VARIKVRNLFLCLCKDQLFRHLITLNQNALVEVEFKDSFEGEKRDDLTGSF
jgi:hypothetical protein